jgi:sulfotransferase family protein
MKVALESNRPIAITGMHRSGTSMITRALHDSGLHLIGTGAEELIDAAEDNPEGFWENKAIVACNDELLEATGGSWDNPPPFPPRAVDDPRVGHVAEAGVAAIAALAEHDHWGFKDPRTCLTAGYWLDLEPDLHFVVCVRHPLEVALSLKRRNQNSYSLGLALWERYYATVMELVPADRRIVTHYDTFFVDPHGELARLCEFAGLTASSPRVRTDLRHHTMQVNLADAGVSAGLRALYADLCRQAGVAPAPEVAPDEGRVRRLVLDGAVAQRHADQRQAEIERLEAREAEADERLRELHAEHRARVRDLEERVNAARKEASDQLGRLGSLVESARRTERALAEIDARTRTTQSRLETTINLVEGGPVKKAARRGTRKAVRGVRRFVVRPGRRLLRNGSSAAGPVAREVAQQLPQPAQLQVRRVRNLVRRGMDEPGPTAKRIVRKLERKMEPRARAAAEQLPPPAQDSLRRARTRVRRARHDPFGTAKKITRRLPPSTQTVVNRAWEVAGRLNAGSRNRIEPEVRPKAAPTPKGPAARLWKDRYDEMVASNVPSGVPWLVVMPGSAKEVRDAQSPKATPFPDSRRGQPFADDLSHIAHLEAQRFAGHRFLVLPEGSVPWFRQQTEFRDHVVRTYRTVVDEEGAGAVFDLTEPAIDSTRSLRGEVTRLGALCANAPAVLDWTDLDVAGELPGLATFRPPPGAELPYLDASVDVVVVDAAHDIGEASRVAALGVIVVAPGASGVDVRSVVSGKAEQSRSGGDASPTTPRILLWSSAGESDDTWREHLSRRGADSGAEVRIGPTATTGPSEDATDYDVVVVVERHVLPLPGSIEAAAALVVGNPDTVVAGKVLRADGMLEAAGGTVFFDRSVGLIATGSPDVRAAWHEYVRPVCWAPGLVALSGALLARLPAPDGLLGRDLVREWCAAVWAGGGRVVYQPTFTAVRVTGNGGEPSVPLRESAWQRVLDLRPTRPDDLTDGAWRYLIAHDDVEACRG